MMEGQTRARGSRRTCYSTVTKIRGPDHAGPHGYGSRVGRFSGVEERPQSQAGCPSRRRNEIAGDPLRASSEDRGMVHATEGAVVGCAATPAGVRSGMERRGSVTQVNGVRGPRRG